MADERTETSVLANCIETMELGAQGLKSKDEVATAIAIYKTLKHEDIQSRESVPLLRVCHRCGDAWTHLAEVIAKTGVASSLPVVDHETGAEI